ncbi:MAG: hypothetical protein DMG72_07740 [Acidobacteria bacterium]|nr:MAG: hypothetical protein DMG72_07740 [Acidobacteriota bacterium]
MAMGELVASIAHEVNQPLTGVVTNANFCLRQLASATPNLEKLREAITEIVNDGTRASAVISRIRALLSVSRKWDRSWREQSSAGVAVRGCGGRNVH